MRGGITDAGRTNELLSQWKLEAESRKNMCQGKRPKDLKIVKMHIAHFSALQFEAQPNAQLSYMIFARVQPHPKTCYPIF